MRALVLGGGGQVGRELRRTAPAGTTLAAPARAELDITSTAAIERVLDEFAPDVVLNAAAYTAVDRAESEPELAHSVNAIGAGIVAAAAAARGARLLHVSTDFVFDGSSSRPYRPSDATAPLGVYGASKLAGERAVLAGSDGTALVLRTSWVYSAHRSNFALTMLRLLEERGEVAVVADQIGSPTWAGSVAAALWLAARRPQVRGIHHWTDAGVASWYDFAVAVRDLAVDASLLPARATVRPLRTEDFPTAARRPAFSVLDTFDTAAALGLAPTHWRRPLARVVEAIGAAA